MKDETVCVDRTSIGPLGLKRQPLKPAGYNANPPKKSLLDTFDDDPLWSVLAVS